jgi:hypothetical protein
MAATIGELFNIEIVRELLLEYDENISPETVLEIWSKCDGNPWNAPVIYLILKTAREQDLRIVKRKKPDGEWSIITMSDLHQGDVFTLFESDTGEQVGGEWLALSEPRIIDGVVGVDAEANDAST